MLQCLDQDINHFLDLARETAGDKGNVIAQRQQDRVEGILLGAIRRRLVTSPQGLVGEGWPWSSISVVVHHDVREVDVARAAWGMCARRRDAEAVAITAYRDDRGLRSARLMRLPGAARGMDTVDPYLLSTSESASKSDAGGDGDILLGQAQMAKARIRAARTA